MAMVSTEGHCVCYCWCDLLLIFELFLFLFILLFFIFILIILHFFFYLALRSPPTRGQLLATCTCSQRVPTQWNLHRYITSGIYTTRGTVFTSTMKSLSVNDKTLLYSMCPATLPSKLANWVPRSISFANCFGPESEYKTGYVQVIHRRLCSKLTEARLMVSMQYLHSRISRTRNTFSVSNHAPTSSGISHIVAKYLDRKASQWFGASPSKI